MQHIQYLRVLNGAITIQSQVFLCMYVCMYVCVHAFVHAFVRYVQEYVNRYVKSSLHTLVVLTLMATHYQIFLSSQIHLTHYCSCYFLFLMYVYVLYLAKYDCDSE